jgi:small subunit ribosomal protein S17
MAEMRQRKQIMGTVVSNKMDNTAVVQVERLVAHTQYHKYVRRQKKYMAHDAENSCDIGDLVLIEECRPMSRHKRWRVVKTVRKVVRV